MAESSLEELKKRYPYVSSNMAETLFAIQANDAQWDKSNTNAKEGIDKLLKDHYGQTYELPQEQFQKKGDCSVEAIKLERIIVTGTTGAGKSATANTLLGRKCFDESSSATSKTKSESGKCKDTTTLVVDTPGSWQTAESMGPEPVPVFYVFVINVACPRFTDQDLNLVKRIQYSNKGTVLKSGRCVAVLTHADSALQRVTLGKYLSEIEGDLLHTFLTKDMGGRFLAVNNSADTSYEREQNQRAILSRILKLQRDPIVGYVEGNDNVNKQVPGRSTKVNSAVDDGRRVGSPNDVDQVDVRSLEHIRKEDTANKMLGPRNMQPTLTDADPTGSSREDDLCQANPESRDKSPVNTTMGTRIESISNSSSGDTEVAVMKVHQVDKGEQRKEKDLENKGVPDSISHCEDTEKHVCDPVKHGGPPHITNPPQYCQIEPDIPNTLQTDRDVARNTHIDPLGGLSTVTISKEKSISKSTPATHVGEDDPPVVSCEKAMAGINIAHKADGQQPGNALCKSQTVTSTNETTESILSASIEQQSRGPRDMQSTVTDVATTDNPEDETQWKAHQESKDKLKMTMDDGKKTISNSASPDENTRVAGKDSERHQRTELQCKTSDLERKDESNSTSHCEDTDNSSRMPLGKMAEEAHTTDDIERGQYPEEPVIHEAELAYIQRPNCCPFHCRTLLSMKIKEHEQTMENLLLKKKNLTLKHELLKIRLEKERC